MFARPEELWRTERVVHTPWLSRRSVASSSGLTAMRSRLDGPASSRTEQLAIVIALGSFGTLGFALTPPILPDLATSFGVSESAIGLVQGSVAVPGIAFSLVVGYLADRLGRKRVVVVSTIIFSIFGLAGFWARSFWVLVGMRFLQGFGISGMLGLGIALVGDLFKGAERTRAVGYNLAGIMVVSMIGPVISGLIATGGTFRPFLAYGLGFLVAAWATRLAIPRYEIPTASPLRHMRGVLYDMRSTGSIIDYGGVLIVTLVSVAILNGAGLTATPLLLESEFGVGVGVRGVVLACFQGGSAIAAFAFARLGGRLGGRAATSGFGLMAAGMATVAIAPTVGLVALGLALTGLGFGTFTSLGQDFAAGAASAAYRGLAVSMMVSVIRISQTVAPPLASFGTDHVGPRSAFAGAAIVAGLTAVSWRTVRRSLRSRW